MKYKEILIEWFSIHQYKLKESSISYYTSIINNHLITSIGDKHIKTLTNKDIQTLILQKATNGNLVTNQGLSYNTIRDIILVFKLSVKYAIRIGIIDSFDFEFVIPHEKKDKLETICKSDQKKLYKYLFENKSNKNICLLIALTTGIRIGELCALQYKDINFKKNTIIVCKTGQRISKNGKTKIIIELPKSKSSIREIPLHIEIIKILENMDYKDNNYLLSNSEKFIEPRTYRNHFNKTLQELNIPPTKFHNLRHTFATECIQLGCDYKAVSDILGHSNIQTTINLYVHPKLDHKKEATNIFTSSLQF